MTPYSITLLIHVTAVFILCAALSIELVSLIRLRKASTSTDAYPWIAPVPKLPIFIAGSVVTILFSGVFLVSRESALDRAWPKVAVLALMVAAPLGAITGKRMRAIRGAYNSQKVNDPEFLDRIRDPFLTISLALRVSIFFGIFVLVSAKPGLWGAISIVATCMVLGLMGARFAGSRRRDLPSGAELFKAGEGSDS